MHRGTQPNIWSGCNVLTYDALLFSCIEEHNLTFGVVAITLAVIMNVSIIPITNANAINRSVDN
jgi:hypothetical protein